MDAETFRADAARVNELQTVLANPILQEALLVIHDSRATTDVDENSSELASARKLSNLAGRADVIRELYELATLLGVPKPPPKPTFGVTEPEPEGWNDSLL